MTDSPRQLDPVDALRISIEEYRFQVRLNADRINYWFTVTVAMLVAGAALANVDDAEWASAVVLLVTAGVALMFAVAVGAQHGYYRAARRRMVAAAEAAGVPGLLQTTPGMRGETGPRVRIVRVVQGVFVALAVVSAVAAIAVTVA